MSSIVARSRPFFGSTRSAKDFRWISIRCGTSRGFFRREKLLRVAATALVPANWATPQSIRRVVRPRKNQAAGLTRREPCIVTHGNPLVKGCWRARWGHVRESYSDPRRLGAFGVDLLDLGGAARLLDLGLELVGLLAVDALLDGFRCLVDQGLGLLEAEPSGRADDLDHADLLLAGARQDEIDRPGFLLRGSIARRSAGRRRGRRDRGRGDAELLLERLDPLGELEHADALELLDPFLGADLGRHLSAFLLVFVGIL